MTYHLGKERVSIAINTDFSTFNDENLVVSANSGNAFALTELVVRFTPFVNLKAGSMARAGIEKADLIQEGMLGLLSAIYSFNEEKASFKTYAYSCVENAMISHLRKQTAKKQVPVSNLVALPEDVTASELKDPENELIEKERLTELKGKIKTSLSSFEYSVFSLFIFGYSYDEISKLLHCNRKSVANSLCRIRRKLKALKSK